MTVFNIIEIVILAVVLYALMLWFNNTKAWVLLRGILVIFIFVIFCAVLQLDTILWIMGKVAAIAAIALVVIFQPELRKTLERLGSKSIIAMLMTPQETRDNGFTEKTANEIVKASFELGKVKTGALMVIENTETLDDIERTGIAINGDVSSQLLINIFEKNTPLHDGAVVIKGNQITAATCYLPLSDNMHISKAYGTRHRAALGISETTDSVTVIVSEETGFVSIAKNGAMTLMPDPDHLRTELNKLIDTSNEPKGFSFGKRKKKQASKQDKNSK